MAAPTASLLSLSLPPPKPGDPVGYGAASSSCRVQRTRRRSSIACSAASPSGSSASEPRIELEFLGPKADGEVARASALSGDKLLRNIMLDNKIDLYTIYGKLMNCGGGGSCGTCIVEIIDGKDLLNERTETEKRYLKKKPESWRLACQTIVGNKENSGKVVVQRLPQTRKT